MDMFRGLSKTQILLAFIISLSIPTLSGYLLYCDLAEDNLFFSDSEYEQADIDDFFLVSSFRNQLKFFGSTGSNTLSPVLLPEAYAVEQIFPFCFRSSCVEQKPLVLRC